MPTGPLSNEQVPGRLRGTLPAESLRQDLTQTKSLVDSIQKAVSALTQKLRRTDQTNGAEPYLGLPDVSGYVLASTTNGKRSWIPSGGGASLPVDFITGLELRFASTTTFTVPGGTAYVTSAGTTVDVTSPFTVNPSTGAGIDGGGTITLGNNTRYFVHLVSSTTVEFITTGPTNYQGTAWESAADNRYIGMMLTDGSAHFINFRRTGNMVLWKAKTASAPFNVVSAASPGVVASKSLSATLPLTAFVALLSVDLDGAGAQSAVAFGTSDGVTPTATDGAPFIQDNVTLGITSFGVFNIPLNSSLTFSYINSATTSNMLLREVGYLEDR